MNRQYTPSYENAQKAYIHNFAYIGEEPPDERLVFSFSIFSGDDSVVDEVRYMILDRVAVWNGY